MGKEHQLEGDTPLPLPRLLIFLTVVWLIGSYLFSIGLQRPIQAVAASYTPGVQVMLQCITIGLIVAWPLLRLSEKASPSPIRQTIVDLLALAVVLQLVIWPMRILTVWTLDRILAIDLALLGWMALAGAVVAAAIGSARSGPRILAMAICMGLIVVGPAIAWLINDGAVVSQSILRFSAIVHINTLTGAGGGPVQGAEWAQIYLLLLIAAACWTGLILWNAASSMFVSRDS